MNNGKIIEMIFNEQLLPLLGESNLTPIDCLLANINSQCVIATDNKIITSLALISDSSSRDTDAFFKAHMCYGDYRWCKEHIIPSLGEKSVWLNTIESYQKGNGYGTEIVQYLKTKYKAIYLLSVVESQAYWGKMNFTHVGDGVYVWSDTIDSLYC